MARSKIHSKLARLRREGARLVDGAPAPRQVEVGAEPAAAQPRSELPSWFGSRLARKEQLKGAAGVRPVGQGAGLSGQGAGLSGQGAGLSAAAAAAAAQWDTTVGDPSGLIQVERLEGTFTAREQRIPLNDPPHDPPRDPPRDPLGGPAAPFRHGDWSLDEVDGADPAVIARIARDPALAGIDLRSATFLDTETSGLSGGAGVYVYMVGLGFFEGDSYVSWQSFLRHPGEERAMLAEVAERIRARGAVVSFFGKSFDRHRLEDKMKIAGVEPPFEGRQHLDLYHPFKRLTQGQLPNGKLQTMERHLLRFQRERDLPGSLAPAAWFDYLAGRPHLLEGVFQHNHEDVLSLVALSAYLGHVEGESRRSGAELVGPAPRRAAALAETALEPTERLRWAEAALARGVGGSDRRRMQLLCAELHRRASSVEAARAAYRVALEECADDRLAIDLFVGASMLLEHQVGDLEHGLRFAERALALGEAKRLAKGQLFALRRRVERLTAKQSAHHSPVRDEGVVGE